jgi:hypothetical protein
MDQVVRRAVRTAPQATEDPDPVHYIEVIMPGSPVLIGGEVPGTITAVTLRGSGHVTYEVSWWDSRTHHSEWIEQSGVRLAENTETLRFGFRRNA